MNVALPGFEGLEADTIGRIATGPKKIANTVAKLQKQTEEANTIIHVERTQLQPSKWAKTRRIPIDQIDYSWQQRDVPQFRIDTGEREDVLIWPRVEYWGLERYHRGRRRPAV
jgi:hypothetical protein